MSSLDSSMHSISTALTTDFYRRFKKNVTDRACLSLARWIIIALGILTVLGASALARFDIKSLFLFFQGLLGLLSSSLVGIFILAVFTRRAHSAGVMTGAIASVALLFYVTRYTDLNFYLYAVVGIATCVVVGYGTSLLIPGAAKDLTGLTFATRYGGGKE
jgi:Na+/proline symporter